VWEKNGEKGKRGEGPWEVSIAAGGVGSAAGSVVKKSSPFGKKRKIARGRKRKKGEKSPKCRRRNYYCHRILKDQARKK